MKICLINHSFPPQIGGEETHLYLLAKGLTDRGHDVTVITGSNNYCFKKGIIKEKFSIIRIKNFRDFEKGKVSFCYILEDLKNALLSKNFDVVHVHNFMPGLAYASLFSLVKTKKTVFTFHSTPIPEEGKIIGHFSDYAAEKAFSSFIISLPFYDNLVCPSKYYYDWALKLGADKNKTKIIYHGIDKNHFLCKKDRSWRRKYGYSEDDFIIICPARMIYRKGIIDIVKAIQIIKDKKIKLFIPTSIQNGSSEYLEEVTVFIHKENLADRIKIAIDKENLQTMPQVFANCNVCVLPSHIEGLGITLLEGMAANMPVIGSNTFGINEIIKDGVNGLLAKPKNPHDLAKKIIRIKKDKKLSSALKKGGKKTIESEFSLKRQLEELELIYQQIS